MSVWVRDRVRRACNELIQKHLDLLLLLLADQGVPAATQRERVDTLVRCLTHARFEESLFVQGRRVPLVLDVPPGGTPVLTFSEEFLEKVDDAELFNAFGRPICELLGLAPINVGLTLQGHDERYMRNIYHSARARIGGEVIRATSIRSVIERRVATFTGRVRELVLAMSGGINLPIPSSLAFLSWLESRQGHWPEWADLASQDFIAQLIGSLDLVLGERPDQVPADALVELCWESLDLSAQSFLRQAARDLRARELPVSEPFLRLLGQVVAREEMEALDNIENWNSFEDLQAIWVDLYRRELDELGRFHHGSTAVPALSPLQAPADSLSLREPEDLPWRHPLLCWSLRETNALRDLLNGFIQTRRARRGEEEDEVALLLVETPVAEPPLDLFHPPRRISTQVVGTTLELPPGYEQITERALHATLARVLAQVESLPPPQRLGVLNRIRGCYEGFFMNTSSVWQRRLQGWRLDPIPVALKRLCLTVSELLGVPVIFDPFEEPHETMLRPVPTFCFIVPLSDQIDRVPFHIPISTLLMTAATGAPPLRLRMVEVPSDPNSPCRWLWDDELTMETMQGQPVQLTLAAVEDDRLRMIAFQ